MKNPKIEAKIAEVQKDLLKLRQAPQDPEKRRAVVREVVGDAELYLEKLLLFLRSL